MSALAVLSLLEMSRVCSAPCLDTNRTWREEVRIWICGAVIIIFVLKDRSEGGVGGAESRRYDHARLAILWCRRCINWLRMGGRDRICITCLLFSSQACSLNHRLALCVIGLIALVHGKNGWIGEQYISRGRVFITCTTNYYTVVWHFVYNIFICIYL